MNRWTLLILIFVTVLLWACASGAGEADPSSADSASKDSSKQNMEQAALTYDDWAQVLERFVDENGMVDYAGLRSDREALDRFLDQIHRVSPRSHPDLFASEHDALAYYINAYNALVFDGVLALDADADSVWGFTGTGAKFFARNKYVVGGEEINLKNLEDEWIRAEFEDPRIHAAINCASMDCPRLPQEPFLPKTLDEQLDAAMTEFVGKSRNVEVSDGGDQVTLSKIFDWFTDDFLGYERARGNTNPTLLDYVNRYRGESQQVPADAEVSFRDYDKALNDQD